jgi:endonuclease YncB( thermonuclease family)
MHITPDGYRRRVATCAVDSGDLSEWLVRNGLALDWPQYSKGRYTGLNAMLKCRSRDLER